MKTKKILRLLLGLAFASASARAQLASIAVGPRPESIVKGWGGKLYVSSQGPSGNLGDRPREPAWIGVHWAILGGSRPAEDLED